MGPTPESCGALLRPLRALMALKQVAVQQAAHDSYPHAAFGVLSELVHRGECRASDLAQHRIVDASVVSRQVAQLEQAGLISRRPDPADGRVALLRATPQGEHELINVDRRRSEFLAHALRDWDEDDVRHLARLLETVAVDLRRAACESNSQTTTREGAR